MSDCDEMLIPTFAAWIRALVETPAAPIPEEWPAEVHEHIQACRLMVWGDPDCPKPGGFISAAVEKIRHTIERHQREIEVAERSIARELQRKWAAKPAWLKTCD